MNYDLSICIPTYKSAHSINALLDELFLYFSNTNIKIEIIVVCDGSPDNSDITIQDSLKKYSDLKYVSLRRNFGEYNAIMCALQHSSGKYVLTMDDDFQNPPRSVEKLYLEIIKGFDVVFSDYTDRKMTLSRRFFSISHYQISNFLLDKPKDIRFSTFKIFTKDIADEILKYKGPFPNLEAHLLKITHNMINLIVDHEDRKFGTSSYNFNKLFDLWLNLILFSNTKISKYILKTGIVLTPLSVISLAFSFYTFTDTVYVLTNFVFFLFSINLIIGGLILEYLGKIYQTQIQSPQFVIKSKSF